MTYGYLYTISLSWYNWTYTSQKVPVKLEQSPVKETQDLIRQLVKKEILQFFPGMEIHFFPPIPRYFNNQGSMAFYWDYRGSSLEAVFGYERA